jgi:c-di-GMP-binding flagellar brake protein YcgR
MAEKQSRHERLLLQPGEELETAVGAAALIEPQGVGKRFRTVFVGWEADAFVVLKLPTKLDEREHLYVGKPTIVRYLRCDGRICGFESKVQAAIYQPHPLLFLDHPKELEVLSLRRQERVDCFLPCELEHGERVIKGWIVNLSAGGCRFAPGDKDDALPPGKSEVACVFSMFGAQSATRANGRVVKTVERDGRTYLSIEFRELSEDIQQRIDAYAREVADHLGASCQMEEVRTPPSAPPRGPKKE